MGSLPEGGLWLQETEITLSTKWRQAERQLNLIAAVPEHHRAGYSIGTVLALLHHILVVSSANLNVLKVPRLDPCSGLQDWKS